MRCRIRRPRSRFIWPNAAKNCLFKVFFYRNNRGPKEFHSKLGHSKLQTFGLKYSYHVRHSYVWKAFKNENIPHMIFGIAKSLKKYRLTFHSEVAYEVPLCSILQIPFFTWNLVLLLELGLSDPKNPFHTEPSTF